MLGRLLLVIGAVAVLLGLVVKGAAAPGASPWGPGYLPNTSVTTQDGKTLRFYDDAIKGKIVVISFIYTTCRDICPVTTARLAQVKDKLGALVGQSIFFVSISIDPANDTPDKLKAYTEAFQTGPDWLFLTGSVQDIAVLRHKLGERSRKVAEHRSDIMLVNDATGEWARDSAFSDINTLVMTIRAMDPVLRSQAGRSEDGGTRAGERHAAGNTTGLPGQALFIKACASCHTIGGGKRIGPDLQALSARRDRGWIVSYLTAPEQMRARKDPIAMQLSASYSVRMPTLGLSEADAADVIAYVEALTYAAAADKKNPHQHHQHRK